MVVLRCTHQLLRRLNEQCARNNGDPLNLVIVGDRASIQECLSAWDETESTNTATAWKTVKAFLMESQYRYSPVRLF